MDDELNEIYDEIIKYERKELLLDSKIENEILKIKAIEDILKDIKRLQEKPNLTEEELEDLNDLINEFNLLNNQERTEEEKEILLFLLNDKTYNLFQ